MIHLLNTRFDKSRRILKEFFRSPEFAQLTRAGGGQLRITPSKDASMRIDLFRRPEDSGRFSYLAVPQGRVIPEEVVSTDWEMELADIELAVTDPDITGLSVAEAERQIDAKGYAITSVTSLH